MSGKRQKTDLPENNDVVLVTFNLLLGRIIN